MRNRLPVKYDPKAAQPVHWLRFLSDLLYPEDSAGEALGAVLEEEVALILLAQLLDQLCAVHGDLLNLLLRLVEHLLALGDGGGIIEVDDRTGI